jgi:mono/diheme cytochrome c family protein
VQNSRVNRWRFLTHAVVMTLVVGVLGVASLGAQSAEDDPGQLEAGMVLFEANCSGCHGVDGTGSNTGRDLTGIAEQEPDRLVHIASVTNGKGNMPVWGESLEPEEIDAAVTYVRLTFVADAAELAVTGPKTPALLLAALVAMLGGLSLLVLAQRRESLR